MGVADEIVTHGEAKMLLAKYGLDVEGIHRRVVESLESLKGVATGGNRLRAVK